MSSISVIVVLFIIICLYLLYVTEVNWCNRDGKFSIQTFGEKMWRKTSIMRGKKSMNKENAMEVLMIVHEVFNKNNIPFWLSEGTALGFYRDGKIISYDDDVDIALSSEYYKKLINNVIPDLRQYGFKVMLFGKSFISLAYKKIDLDIDITGPGLFCVSFFKSCEKILHLVENLDTIIINKRTFNIPTLSYYEEMYGKDWMIPRKNKKAISGVFSLDWVRAVYR